jgi:sugar lactone lactonase YvrE
MRVTSNVKAVVFLVITLSLFLASSQARSADSSAMWDGRQEQTTGPVLKFTLPEHDLYPENIAYDPVSRTYFLGSMSRPQIIRIREDGSYEDFVSPPETGLLSSVGMKVDARRRALWVCTGRFNLMADFASMPAKTGVLKFNIDDGTLLGKWLLDEDQASHYHIFNDLVLASNGDAYVTTTLIGRVYRISAETGRMELLLQLNQGSHNNGITLDPQEKYLFLTIDRSISRLELATGELVEIKDPTGRALIATDGLYFYNNSLVAVKPRLKQVSQIFLDEDLTTVERAEVLAQNHPDFAYPTTGVIVGDKLVFVATSYADIPRNSESSEQHPDVKIYEVQLKND